MTTYIDPSRDQYRVFKELQREGPIHMLNLVRLRPIASYPDGRQLSGEAAYRAYAAESAPVFQEVGGKQFWVGRFEHMLIGPSDERWDHVFIAEYPSQEAFIQMLADPRYREAVKHRQAAVEDSRLIRMEPKRVGPRFGETHGA
jgi:uncharacterized protein (DUF1330 family)